MNTSKLKRIFSAILILMVLLSATACSNGSGTGSGGSKKLDVILWNTNGDKFPEASGVSLVVYAAKEFESKTGIKVNLVPISAENQKEYFEKRSAVLSSKDQPEMILFSTRNLDELLEVESMKNDLLHIDGIIENVNDVYEGMKGEHYCAFATLVYGNLLNNALVSELGYDANAAFMTAEEVETLYLNWAKTEGAELNLFDYRNFSELGMSSMMHISSEEVSLDKNEILDKIKRNQAFVETLPERSLSEMDVIEFYSGKNKAFYNQERDTMTATVRFKPVNFLTKVSFNAFDLMDFSSNISTVASGVAIGDYSLTASVGFGILDNQSSEQTDAIAFANFLLSDEFQKNMQGYTKKSPKMSGSVLRSVNANNSELAHSQSLLQNGKPIQKAVITAHDLMANGFDQQGAMTLSAISSISIVTFEELYNLSTLQIWGVAKTDEELLDQLDRLEDRLNQMISIYD